MASELMGMVNELSEDEDNTDIYVDIDDFWNDNWHFVS